jgi:hypothetical protein
MSILSLTAAQREELQAWDGSRIKALLALIAQYGPTLLPIILNLFGMKAEDDDKLKAAPERELTAVDWKAIIQLILTLLAQLFPSEPTT